LAKLAGKLGSALWDHPQQALAKLARQLNDAEAPDNLRIEWLTTVLKQHKVLLVLDNFEDVLTAAGGGFRDPVPEQIFGLMLRAAERGRLLITCRHPVPGAEHYLRRIDLGPLSRAETRKLMLRLEGLAQQPSQNVKQIERAIGGHPRTLEYLDALLRHGAAQLGRVRERLEKYAEREGIALDGSDVLAERLQDAIRIAAADAMVAELVRVVGETPGDLKVLWQASVFPFPVPEGALVFDGEAGDPAALSSAVDRLVASSLLAQLEERHVFVHRWTAESLKAFISAEDYRRCCFRAAAYLEKREVSDRRQWVADLTESMRLFLAAREFDGAARLTWVLLGFLRPYGQTTVWTELLAEATAALPDGHEDKLRFIGTEGDGLRALGFGAEAYKRYSKALEIAERMVRQEPGRADYLRDLWVSYNNIGDLQRALGNGETARQFYEKTLEIAERLVEQEPERADNLRDLSVSYNKMGDSHGALGQEETARQFYEKALEIAERLVKQEPGRADYKVDLARSLARMGDAERLRRAFEMLSKMKQASELMAGDERVLDYVKGLMQSRAAGSGN
jgi:tetratricopeptide (TPR) repeat protein